MASEWKRGCPLTHRLIVLSVASSPMAALILIDGWTAHSMLGIPIPINEASFSYIKKNSEKADMLRHSHYMGLIYST